MSQIGGVEITQKALKEFGETVEDNATHYEMTKENQNFLEPGESLKA